MHGTLALPAADLAPRTFARAPLHSADDLRRAVLRAHGSPLRVDSSSLDRVLRLDPAADRIEVQSATTWRALAEHAARAAPALAVFAQDPWLPQTIGQGFAENAPGPDGRPLVEHVDSAALITPDGLLRRASRDTDPELLALAIGGHGAFGVPYSITLRMSSLARSAAQRLPIEALDLHPCGDLATDRLVLYVPPGRAEDFLGEARFLAQEWRVAIARAEVRGTHAESQTRLCWARRDYAAVALHLLRQGNLGGKVRAVQLQRSMIEVALACGGSFQLSPKAPVAREQVLHCYPMMTAFLAARQRYDPDERLENDWTRRYRTLLRCDTREVRWARA